MIVRSLILFPCLFCRQGFIFALVIFSLISCSSDLSDAQKIIDKSILVHGGEKYLSSTIEFDFRDRHYIAHRESGKFSYERVFQDPKDSTRMVHDFLFNEGFRREINNQSVAIPDSMARKYSSSVNSVLYFALLPYGLNDPSVNKKLLGTTVLDGVTYYKIEITFGPEGGEDYEDACYFWIHKENFKVDYMAYSYEESDGRDIRFRKAINSRIVKGIVFQDYINYKPKASGMKLEAVETLFKTGEMEELSRIELENISVVPSAKP